jgi:hypothetical protein
MTKTVTKIRYGFEDAETAGFEAIERRKLAAAEIVRLACELARTTLARPQLPERFSLFEQLMASVGAYNQASEAIHASQVSLGVRPGP